MPFLRRVRAAPPLRPTLCRPTALVLPTALVVVATLTACASAGPPRGSADDARTIHAGVQASERGLEGALLEAMPGDAPARLQARAELELELREAYRPVLGAWTAFGDYAAATEAALAVDGPGGARMVRDAFHALHVALLETRLADDFGIDAERHRALLQILDGSPSAATALVLAGDWAVHLADRSARHARLLEFGLQELEAAARTALRRESLDLRDRRLDMREEEARLAQQVRRRAAGVGEVEGDPARDLRLVRAEMKEVEAALAAQEERGEGLTDAFQDACADARLAAEGFAAWGAAHARMVAAVRDGRGSAPAGRLHDIARELAP